MLYAAGSAIETSRRRNRGSDDHENVTLPEQHAPTGRAVAADLPGRQPSINRSNIDPAQTSDLPFRQQLRVIEVFRQNAGLPVGSSAIESFGEVAHSLHRGRGGGEGLCLCGTGFDR